MYVHKISTNSINMNLLVRHNIRPVQHNIFIINFIGIQIQAQIVENALENVSKLFKGTLIFSCHLILFGSLFCDSFSDNAHRRISLSLPLSFVLSVIDVNVNWGLVALLQMGSLNAIDEHFIVPLFLLVALVICNVIASRIFNMILYVIQLNQFTSTEQSATILEVEHNVITRVEYLSWIL